MYLQKPQPKRGRWYFKAYRFVKWFSIPLSAIISAAITYEFALYISIYLSRVLSIPKLPLEIGIGIASYPMFFIALLEILSNVAWYIAMEWIKD